MDMAVDMQMIATPKHTGWLWNRKQADIGFRRDLTGARCKFIVVSNGYVDRDGERVLKQALDEYVKRSWITDDKCFPQNPHMYYHLIEDGDITWCKMKDGFLTEVARERPGTFRYRGRDYDNAILWDHYQATVKEGWGASHKFLVMPHEKEKGEFSHIWKKETTSLLLKHAANAYTYSGDMDMDEEKMNEALDNAFGISGLAAKLGKLPSKLEKALTEVGEESKSLDLTTVGKQAPPPTATKPANEKQPPPPEEKPPEEQEAAPQTKIEMLRDSILQVVGSMQDADPAELSKAIEDAIVAAVNSAQEAEKPADSTPQAMQPQHPPTMMTDKALDTATDTATTEPGQTVDPVAVNKSLTDLVQEVITDVEAIASAQEQDREAVSKALEPVIKRLNELPATLISLDQRLNVIEKQMNGRPRIASRDPLTSIKDSDLPEEIQKNIKDEDYENILPSLKVRKA